jgi:hypothetical protein
VETVKKEGRNLCREVFSFSEYFPYATALIAETRKEVAILFLRS